MTRSTCLDCATDWMDKTLVKCPMCGGSNINAVVAPVETIVIPALSDWVKKVNKVIKENV